MVQIIKTSIENLKIVQLDIYEDPRGFFTERFNKDKFQELGLITEYFQDNWSLSKPGVLRGLHYQNNPSQTKLVGCISGRIWDVAVDIRPKSKTFGQHFAMELNEYEGKMLYIPSGFAHGFCVIGNKPAHVMYKADNKYSKEGEGGLIYNDKDLDIKWPIKNPILSDKDLLLPKFSDLKND